MCSSSQGALPFARTARRHRRAGARRPAAPTAPGLGPAPSSWYRAGWGHCGERAARGGCTVCGGVQAVPRARMDLCEGSRGEWGTAGLCRRGSSSLGSRWQPGRCRHRELGPGQVSAPPGSCTLALPRCTASPHEGGQGALASPASSCGGERRSATGISSSKRRQKKLIFPCKQQGRTGAGEGHPPWIQPPVLSPVLS